MRECRVDFCTEETLPLITLMEQESTLTAKKCAKNAKEDSYRGSARMHADFAGNKPIPLITGMTLIFTDQEISSK